jgi:hypothetical protein
MLGRVVVLSSRRRGSGCDGFPGWSVVVPVSPVRRRGFDCPLSGWLLGVPEFPDTLRRGSTGAGIEPRPPTSALVRSRSVIRRPSSEGRWRSLVM